MHSATKYLNGHSDMVGGIVVVGEDAELAEQMAFLQNSVGAVQGPFDSFLALRGVKTLPLRMRAHNENALALAQSNAAAQPADEGSLTRQLGEALSVDRIQTQFFNGIAALGVQTAQTGGVAYWAHIGGFVFGVLAGLRFRGRGEAIALERPRR